ncbi:bifunctional aldolase/short-chain dehydrogenase [Solirubrobacter sp. CPCC 204708]|uniref:Bifunctional aldolase/short-chain dehydrogenase n=1 Tax=Solirubrobacter deserti TaxID=2282478 RepID=A0ABT4RUU7_9ACTN|nr:bifunctional aldolase/short-chain dehydrogenase [Solirubrobacter deserti]MBE2320738.1 bifunctional aldolase/short-chain dehydrogenase [Solirubrobacter deserti]MDA0142349.1 bifunctional aldolase/short-chain dehydrogenase [Solirubrobacter deserti]
MSTVTPIIDSVEDLWPADGGPGDALGELVLASHLLGANRAVSNFGGGNTSAKGTTVDHTGREINAMWVKGSGSDLATMGPEHFTGLKLDEVLPLLERDEMSDEDMVAYLAQCQLDPKMPRASIETLLHAFVPAPHVHHTHPDGINVLAGTADGERLIHECFGDEAAWIPYIRPGFTLSKQVGLAVRENPNLKLVVLAKHGLIVWGESAEEAYRKTIEVINQAVAFVNAKTGDTPRFGGRKLEPAGSLTELLPAIRGAVSSERAKVLTVDTSERVMEFVCSQQAERLVKVGAPCPDHLVHTKRLPLWISRENATPEKIAELAEQYRADYRAYFESFAGEGDVPGDPDPRVVLVEGMGLVSTGTTTKLSKISRDLYHRAIEVIAGAEALGQFVSLDAGESFAIEYWPLELYKLAQAPAPGELQGKVALVTGGAGGIGRAIIDSLASAGACVVAFDLDGEGATEAVSEYGDRGLAVAGDVTSEEAVAGAFRAAVEAFGGVDIVVSNAGIASSAALEETTLAEWNRNHAILSTGYFLVSREAFKVLRAQDNGGSVVFVASKNAVVAGKNAAAYSSAKAAELHLARCLAEEGGSAGIRVNTVNPDAVLQGSKIWGSSWREERAAAYNLDPEQLDEHYRQRNTLKVSIYPGDIAEAVLHFASERRSGKSTGNMLNVDGGVPAAYAR